MLPELGVNSKLDTKASALPKKSFDLAHTPGRSPQSQNEFYKNIRNKDLDSLINRKLLSY